MREQPSSSFLLLACAAAWSMAIPSLFAQEADGRKPPDAEATAPQPRVTGEFKRAELTEVISFIAKQAGANVVIDKDVKGDVTMRFTDTPWMKALDAVVKTAGYAIVEEDRGRILHIVDPAKLETQLEKRLFHFKYIKPSEFYPTGIATPRAKSLTLLDALRAMLTKSPGAQAPDPSGAPARTLGRLEYFIDQNSILVVDTKPVLDRMAQVIQDLDVEPVQILLDVMLLTTRNADLIQMFSMWSHPPEGGSVDRNASKFPFHVGRALGNSTPNVAGAAGLNAYELTATLRLCCQDPDTEFIQRPNVAVGTRIHFATWVGDKDDNAPKRGPGILQVIWDEASGAAKDASEVCLIPHVIPGTTRVLMTIIPSVQVPDKPSSEPFSAGAGEAAPTDGFPYLEPATMVTHLLIEANQTIVIDCGQTKHPSPAAGEGRVANVSPAHFFLLVSPHIVRLR